MAKITINVTEVGCRKPGCKRRLSVPQRHHRRWETLFINAFASLVNSKAYRKFCDRYYSFHPDDVISLCDWHHAEIHHHYREIVAQDKKKTRKPIHSYSWRQAEKLMNRFLEFCLEWEKKETPGMNPVVVWPDTNGRANDRP